MNAAAKSRSAWFVGIAGAGMSALASVLMSEGWRVAGSDEGVFPPMDAYLDRLGVDWRDGFDAARIPADLDVAIVGSSAKLDLGHNPELAELERRGVPRFGFAEFLGEHTKGRFNVVVAGSFGKSTLTALAAFLMREAGRDPGYFIGAAPLDLATSGSAGTDPLFLIEGDEYVVSLADRRPKFDLYHPSAALISSIVHDHVNVYPTPESYEAAFAGLIARLPAEAPLVCAAAYPALHRLTQARRVVWYGLERCDGYWADVKSVGETTCFDLVAPDGARIAMTTGLLGAHNIENIVGAAALLLELKAADPPALAAGVAKFRGVARRLDKKTHRSRAPVYEGFGSSYEKARSAIEAVVRHFPDRPLVVVFEPHAFSWRDAAALAWYDHVFDGAAEIVALPPPLHGAGGHAQLSQSQIVDRIRAAGVNAHAAAGAADVLAWTDRNLTGDEVVLLLSSGPLDGLAASLPARLDERFA